jgi:hypothetical protein
MRYKHKLLSMLIALNIFPFLPLSGDGIVYIPGSGNSPNGVDNFIRENQSGYISITIEYVNMRARGASFLGLESGVGFGISNIQEDIRKDLFDLPRQEEKKVFFFNRSERSSRPNVIKDQPMHQGHIPICDLNRFKIEPLIFVTDDPKGDQEDQLKKILSQTEAISNLAGVDIGGVLKVANLTSNELVKIFNLKGNRYLLKDPTPFFDLGTDATQPTQSTLKTGKYLLFCADFEKFFHGWGKHDRFDIKKNWKVGNGNWAFREQSLYLNGKEVITDKSYMLIRVEWTDTIFKKGTYQLRGETPSHMGPDSAFSNVITSFKKAQKSLKINTYSASKVLEALRNASAEYDVLKENLDLIKHLDANDKKQITSLTQDRILQDILSFSNNDSDIVEWLKVDALKKDWEDVLNKALLVDARRLLPADANQTKAQSGEWLKSAIEHINDIE